jgi:hypothetical protein
LHSGQPDRRVAFNIDAHEPRGREPRVAVKGGYSCGISDSELLS